eukprot:757704-Hanusia_phi.AAC.1
MSRNGSDVVQMLYDDTRLRMNTPCNLNNKMRHICNLTVKLETIRVRSVPGFINNNIDAMIQRLRLRLDSYRTSSRA